MLTVAGANDGVCRESHTVMNAPNRRAIVKAGAALLAGMLAPALARAQGVRGLPSGPTVRRPTPPPPLIPRPAGADPTLAWNSPALRLARKVSFGLDAQEAARAQSMGYAQYLEYQLAPDLIDDSAVDAFVASNFPLVAADLNTLFAANASTLQEQLPEATIFRSAFSTRQLTSGWWNSGAITSTSTWGRSAT